jgi:hypothetical protein
LHTSTFNTAVNRYPTIFKGKSGKKSNIGFEGWLYAIAETGITSSLREAKELRVWEMFEILNYLAEKADL